jgi:phosphatidylserine decarboxylase
VIAREGWLPITSFGVVAVVLTLHNGPLWALPGWVFVAFLLFVYRFPKRDVPALPLAVVSPVDGRVVMARKVQDPWLHRPALCVGIRMNAPGITPIRSPTEGKVMEFWTQTSTCLSTPRDRDEANGAVACYALWVRTDEGDDIVMAVSASRSLSRFKSDVAPGERIGQGHRNGFVYLGSQVDVLLPAETRPHVVDGQRTLAGCGVIATLVHR